MSRGPRQSLPYPAPVINGHRLVRWIGSGGMGAVFQAEKGGQQYALKTPDLRWGVESGRGRLRERFAREARLGCRIRHPNVVSVFEHGIIEPCGIPYLVMEYLEGAPISEMPLGELACVDYDTKAAWMRDTADALAALARDGVVHRDIKPGNIMVCRDGRAKLCDLGIAYELDSRLTGSDGMLPIGSWQYVAPEGFSSPRRNSQSDIFSLGVTSYELMVGQHPFCSPDREYVANRDRILTGRPKRPSSLRHDFPPTLEGILARMLKKSPEQRYSTAKDVAHDLARYLDGELFDAGGIPPSADWS